MIPRSEDLHTAFSIGSILPIQHGSFLPDVCAFLNTDGGKMYFGVNRYGKVIGLDDPTRLIDEINSRICFSYRQGLDKKYLDYIKTSQLIVGDKVIVVLDVIKLPKNQEMASVNGFYYFRTSNKTFRTDENGIDYALKVINHNFPVFTNYMPNSISSSHYWLIFKGNIRIQYIGEIPKGAYLYKYMDLESALRSLEPDEKNKKTSLRFVEPTNWEDQYEGRFYNANYFLDNDKRHEISSELTPFLYACCFTTKRDNEAAWSLYSHNKTGLASRCVEFRIKKRELYDQLFNYALDNKRDGKYPSIFFGNVIYYDKFDIDNLHIRELGASKEDNINYHKYFDNFSLECYLDLLLLKRVAFEHEKELRVFIIPPDHKDKKKTKRNKKGQFSKGMTPDCIFVNVNWSSLIEEVRIDKRCSDYEKSILQKKLNILYEEQKEYLTRIGTSFDDDKLKRKFQLVEFDPYEDESLKKGPISVITN